MQQNTNKTAHVTGSSQRIGQPEDIAGVNAFLCSYKARWIDGALIPVDGGTML